MDLTQTYKNTQLLIASKANIALAGKAIRNGELVAFPTETVYGLGADATNDLAIKKIYQAKGRPPNNPLIVHLASKSMAEKYGLFDDNAHILADSLWPGPLTIVLPLRQNTRLAPSITTNLPTIALRVPAHSTSLDIIKSAGVPIAAPSANRSGRISPTTASHVLKDLNRKIALIIDSGSCQFGIESTVIMTKNNSISILRPGAISQTEIEDLINVPITSPPKGKLLSPGMLEAHYAPKANLRINAKALASGEALLCFGGNFPKGAAISLNLSTTGDLSEAASNLYAYLRELDTKNIKSIAVSPIPNTGLGVAINDRLKRATTKIKQS